MADTRIPAGVYPDSSKFSNSLIRKQPNEPKNIFHKNDDKDIKAAKQHEQDRSKLEGIINSLQK
ncbi:MAG: hypothetical protein WCG23_12790 [bacterium]